MASVVEQVRLLYPWMPEAIRKRFVDAWIEHGNPEIALAELRTDPVYDRYFPGIKRDDGSLRMTEQEYFATKDGYSQVLREYGLNPKVFEGRFVDLITNDVSMQEFGNRLSAAWDGIASRTPQIRQWYADNYGMALSDEAILASAIDPQIGQAVLNKRIAASQIGGVAAEFGFDRGVNRATRLAETGLDEQGARQLYAEARRQLPTLDSLAKRWYDPDGDVSITEFESAAVVSDPTQTRRFRSLAAAEQSAFSGRQGQVREEEDGGLTGLRRR